MKQEIKEKWIEGLRSGKYTQGRTFLRDKNNKYCCLGVLCDVMGKAWEKDINNYYITEGNIYYLSHLILDEVGLTYDQQAVLIHMNDSNSNTFDEISSYVETL